MNTIKNIAASACNTRACVTFGLMAAVLALAGCAALPEPPPRASVYDFGPGLALLGAGVRVDGQAQQALHAALDGLGHLGDRRIRGVQGFKGAHQRPGVGRLALHKAHAIDATDQVAHVLALARDVLGI